MAAQDYYGVVQQLYVTYFGRPADHYGLENYAAQLNALGAPTTYAALVAQVQADKAGTTALGQLVNSFNNSQESTDLYGSDNSQIGIAKFVQAIYQNLLGREPDAEGFTFWVNAITSGGLSKSYAAAAIADGALKLGNDDAKTVANKVAVATNFTDALNTPSLWTAYSGDAAAQSARDLLSNVNSTTDTTAYQTQVQTTIGTISNGANVGTTYALTEGVDSFTGTSANDIFTGTEKTVTGLDVINGGAGNDKLVLSDTTGSLKLSLLSVSNIESLEFTSAAGVEGGTADVSGWTGLTSAKFALQNVFDATTISLGDTAAGTISIGATDSNLTVNGGTTVAVTQANGAALNAANTITVNGGAATTAVTVDQTVTGNGTAAKVVIADKNYAGTKANTIASVTLSGLTDGAATISSKALSTVNLSSSDANVTINNSTAKHTITLNLDDVSGGTIKDAAATTVNVNAAGDVSGVTLDAGAATALNIGGEGAVSLGLTTQVDKLAIVSTNSTGVEITSALTTNTTFTGGDGDDVISLNGTNVAINTGAGDDVVTIAAALGSKATIDGGDGVDTLSFTSAIAQTVSATDAFGKQISNFEKISLGAVAELTTNTINLANLGNINYVIAEGTGATGTFEKDTVTFGNLNAGQSVTINGITVTATNGNATAAQVAAAVLTGTVTNTNLTVTGTAATDWTAAAGISADQVVYTSTKAGDVTNIAATVAGVVPTPAPAVSVIDGKAADNTDPQNPVAATNEQATVTFAALTAGQKVTVGDVTLSASMSLTAEQVADAFASGNLSGPGFTKSAASVTGYSALLDGTKVVFTSQSTGDVTDLTTDANGTAAPAAPLVSEAAGVNGSALVLNGFAANGTLELTGAVDGSATVSLASTSGTSDVFNLVLNGASSLANTGTVTVAGVETINITTAHSGDADVSTAATLKLAAAAATTVTVTGDHGIDFTDSVLSALTTLDASGVTAVVATPGEMTEAQIAAQIGEAGAVTFTAAAGTKALTISTGNGYDVIDLHLNTKGATISTGEGKDVITGTTGADTIDAGAGNDIVYSTAGGDTITLGAGTDAFVLVTKTDSTIDKYTTITDFSANTAAVSTTDNTATTVESKLTGDVIDLHSLLNGVGIKVFVASNASDATTFLQNTGNAFNATTSNYTGIALDSTTGLLYIDLDHNGVADSVIKLTGVTTITEAAFVTHLS